MKKLDLYTMEEKLSDLNIKIFRPRLLEQIFNVRSEAVNAFLHYNYRKGAILRLRNGFYALKQNLPSEYAIANQIYTPSYISLQTALSFHNLIPETVYSIISVTPLHVREFTALGQIFAYRQIKKEAYTGYQPRQIQDETIFMADPEKALADYLYFVSLGKTGLNDRLYLDKINKFQVEEYLKLFKLPKLLCLWRKICSTKNS